MAVMRCAVLLLVVCDARPVADLLRLRGGFSRMPEPPAYSTATGKAVAADQELFTQERLAGFSKGMLQHLFEEVDGDGSGELSYSELDLLTPYFSDEVWNKEFKDSLFQTMDKNSDGAICADEFYSYMVENAKLKVSADGKMRMEQRDDRLKVSKEEVPPHLIDMLVETGAMETEQKVTHALHSGYGRTIGDHFISCYLILKEWGNPEPVCQAGALHAAYQRGDGLQTVDPKTMRPALREKLGADVEELVYLFPSAHKSVLAPDGLLHAPLGRSVTFPDLLDGGAPVTIDPELRRALAELEVVNSFDQARATVRSFQGGGGGHTRSRARASSGVTPRVSVLPSLTSSRARAFVAHARLAAPQAFLCNEDPVQNLWQFYQHVTVMPLLSKGAAETVKVFQQRSFCSGVTCDDIVEYHEGRFSDGMDEKWSAYCDMFRPGGRYYDIEKILHSFLDEDGYTGDGCDVLPGRAGGN